MRNWNILSGALFFLFAFNACTKGSGDENNGQNTSDTSSYTKNVLIMEFVSFDCVYCPAVTDVLSETADKKYPGRVDIVSVHGRLDEDDPMEFNNYKQFQNYFYGVTGYPGVIIDQHDDLVSVGSFDPSGNSFQQRINASVPVGLAISTLLLNDNTVKVDVKVSNKGEASGDYRLAAVVLENDIPYKQADLVDGSLQWIENYKHHHVLRSFLTKNYFGDTLGVLNKNDVYSKSFTYTIPEGYIKNNLSFVAYLVEAKGFSHRVSVNSRSVAIGKSIDFSGKVY